MANLERIISKKTEDDAQWKEQRQAERENTVALRDAGVTEITSHPEEYARFLEMQGNNPLYSAGNIALVMLQLDGASQFGSRDRWKKLGRTVLETEKGNGAKIFIPAEYPKHGYEVADAFDITQTQGKAVKEIHLHNGSKEMDTALTTLLNYSPVPLVTDSDLDCPAIYDPERQELHINPACEDSEAFAAIATEIAQARFHNKGRSRFYNHDESQMDAESISYILCRRFGIKCELPDTGGVAKLYEGWDVAERTEALNKVHDMAKQIGGSIERQITPQQSRTVRQTR